MVIKIQRNHSLLLFFSKAEKSRIVSAIKEAEKKTSAEIRIHLEREFSEQGVEHARKMFERLGMHRTKDRNGVLILLGIRSRSFTVLGDQGIHEKVPQGFWDEIAQSMLEKFKADRFSDGIVYAIEKIGEKLRTYFPHERDDKNELPDGISYSL